MEIYFAKERWYILTDQGLVFNYKTEEEATAKAKAFTDSELKWEEE